ncbi:MAG: ABC transporter permease [Acidimicrobiia bacterium]
MSWPRVVTVARNDLRQLRASRDFWVPLMIIALFMFVVVPAVMLYVISTVQDPRLLAKFVDVVGRLPEPLRARLANTPPEIQASYTLAVYFFAPLVTLVPLTISSSISANTFVGERERGSGEFLAHSPASTTDIYLGKLIAALIPGFLTAIGGLIVYSAVVNLIVSTRTNGVHFPAGNWWVFVLWVMPPLITVATALIVSISSRVTSGAAAQQASSLIALPIVILAYAVSQKSLFGSASPAWIVGGVAWVAAAVAIWRGAASLRRERLLGIG